MKQKLLLSRAKLLPILLFFMLLNMVAFSQKTVTGKVASAAAGNLPVVGATVKVKGTKTGTSTNSDGTFAALSVLTN